MSPVKKDPNSTLDYTWDWTAWLGTDTIATSTFIVPTGLTLVTQSHTTKTTTAWLSGGVLDEIQEVTNRITTTGGRTEDWTMQLLIGER